MGRLLYFLTTLSEAALSVFGIRSAYEQPRYHVVETLAPLVEIRHYDPRVAVQTPTADGEGAAFGRLFRYIGGANTTGRSIAMTAPVEERAQRIAMTVPVERSGGPAVMRFFLPASVVAAGAPVPADKAVIIVSLPAVTLGVIRYAGIASQSARAAQTGLLRTALARAGRVAQGEPIAYSYDPPFALPFLRRNEMALEVTR